MTSNEAARTRINAMNRMFVQGFRAGVKAAKTSQGIEAALRVALRHAGGAWGFPGEVLRGRGLKRKAA